MQAAENCIYASDEPGQRDCHARRGTQPDTGSTPAQTLGGLLGDRLQDVPRGVKRKLLETGLEMGGW